MVGAPVERRVRTRSPGWNSIAIAKGFCLAIRPAQARSGEFVEVPVMRVRPVAGRKIPADAFTIFLSLVNWAAGMAGECRSVESDIGGSENQMTRKRKQPVALRLSSDR
jgi:hypothetical protein